MIKIKSVYGFEIRYSPEGQTFFLLNKNHEEIGSGKTQDEMESLAKKLNKEKFEPVLAFEEYGLSLRPHTITSLNAEERSFWHTDDESKRRAKQRLGWSQSFWLRTKTNEAIAKKLTEITAQVETLEDKARGIMKKLERPINSTFFGISDD